METSSLIQILRLVGILALLIAAAALATPRGRLPLALRGIRRMLRRDCGLPADSASDNVAAPSPARRAGAFLLVLLALVLALLHG